MPGTSPTILSIEDLTDWSFVKDPRISPDGEAVAFVLADVARPDEHDRAAIWMLDLRDDSVRRFTYGPGEDTHPRWSPDGSRLAFLTDRNEPGTKQLYVMSARGGEAFPLGRWKGDISQFEWSPDGKTIAVIAKDPETDEDEKRKKERRDHVVRERDYKYSRVFTVPADGGDLRLLSAEGKTHVSALSWLPDSSAVIALHVPGPTADYESAGPSELIRYELSEGSTAETVLRLETGVEQPSVSPDGKHIAFRSKAGRVTASDQIWVIPLTGGTPTLLTPGYEGSVEAILWSHDSQEVLFTSVEDLWGALRAVDVESLAVRSLVEPGAERQGTYGPCLTASASGTRLATVRHSMEQPPNIWIIENCIASRRSNLNTRLTECRYAKPEAIAWQSDGVDIHGLLVRPLDFDEGRRYPLVVLVHGGPAWHWSNRFLAGWHDWTQVLAQRGYAVLLPNPRGSVGRGSEFTDANINDFGGGEYRDMMSGVDHVIGLGFVDDGRLGIGGWSWGGYMTAWTVTQTDRFTCAIMGAGLSNLASDQGQNDVPRMNDDYFDVSAYEDAVPFLQASAVTHMKHAKTPTLILHGEKDERVGIPQSWEMYRGLQWAGVEVEMVTYPREPHGIRERAHQQDLLERVLAWYGRFLQP